MPILAKVQADVGRLRALTESEGSQFLTKTLPRGFARDRHESFLISASGRSFQTVLLIRVRRAVTQCKLFSRFRNRMIDDCSPAVARVKLSAKVLQRQVYSKAQL